MTRDITILATILLYNAQLICKQEQIMHQTQILQVAKTETPGRLDRKKAVRQFEQEMAAHAQENSKIPQKDDSILRIMSYNVHYWMDPRDDKDHMQRMLTVIKDIDPDIIIIQELSPSAGYASGKDFKDSNAEQALQNMGFISFSTCNTLEKQWFGNIIASKIPFNYKNSEPFESQMKKAFEIRCFVLAQIVDKIKISIYGTHLEVNGDDTLRKTQIEEIIKKEEFPVFPNALIAADCNATRESEVIKVLEKAGFKDCFTYMGWQHPHYTNWTGKEIDFIFLSPGWNLPLAGCYVYYDASSDHIPVIMDIRITAIAFELEKFETDLRSIQAVVH